METPLHWWVLFNLFVLAMLALDLGVFHRKAHAVRFREALTWTIVWIAMALLFNLWVWHSRGAQDGLMFLTGYVVEKSLSVDNVFVFAVVFAYFGVPAKYQHKVLFWGILGALIMRAVFIFLGVALIERFHWIIYVFGAFLILTGIKMLVVKDKKIEPDKNPVLKLFKRTFPTTNQFHEDRFFVREGGRLVATPLFVTLIFVEMTDVIFAVDSIPAILAITTDTFIVYTSNVFAILGLRALYFCLAGFMDMFRYLGLGLAIILIFIGIKMLVTDLYGKIPVHISLGVIAAILTVSVVASFIAGPQKSDDEPPLPPPPADS